MYRIFPPQRLHLGNLPVIRIPEKNIFQHSSSSSRKNVVGAARDKKMKFVSVDQMSHEAEEEEEKHCSAHAPHVSRVDDECYGWMGSLHHMRLRT